MTYTQHARSQHNFLCLTDLIIRGNIWHILNMCVTNTISSVSLTLLFVVINDILSTCMQQTRFPQSPWRTCCWVKVVFAQIHIPRHPCHRHYLGARDFMQELFPVWDIYAVLVLLLRLALLVWYRYGIRNEKGYEIIFHPKYPYRFGLQSPK